MKAKKTRYSCYNLNYHLVWIPKYRRKILTGNIAKRLSELLRETAKSNEIEILNESIQPDHVHLFPTIRDSIAADDVCPNVALPCYAACSTTPACPPRTANCSNPSILPCARADSKAPKLSWFSRASSRASPSRFTSPEKHLTRKNTLPPLDKNHRISPTRRVGEGQKNFLPRAARKGGC